MGIPDKTGKGPYKGTKHGNDKYCDDSMEHNLKAAMKARRVDISEEVQEDYSITGKQRPRSKR